MYKDLSLKEKAKVIREGVRLGLNSIDDILSLYDEAISYLQGGPIVTPYGQWKYPGKDTIIPSNNITMDNVNYPVLGISDTGDTKVMMPWNDYKFRGSVVYEHPLIGNQFQLGGNTKPTFDLWYPTVPKQKNDTSSYDLRRAYNMLPFDEMEKFRTINNYHLPSVAYDEKTDTYTFLKRNGHPTLNYELDWYNSGNPDALEFRERYKLDTLSLPWRYIPNIFLTGGLVKKPEPIYNENGQVIGRRYVNKDNSKIIDSVVPQGRVNFQEFLKAKGKKARATNFEDLELFLDSLIARGYNEPLRLAFLATSYNEMDNKGAASRGIGGNGYMGFNTIRMPLNLLNDSSKQIQYILNDTEKLTPDNWTDGGSGGPYIKNLTDAFNKFWNETNPNAATLILNKANIRPAKLSDWYLRASDADLMKKYMEYPELPKEEEQKQKKSNKLLDSFVDFILSGGLQNTPSYADGGNLFKKGGIYIKPENRGKFTALKKRTGHSASWFKAHGTPALKKMATFALNARKWKHLNGGNLFQEGDKLFVVDKNNNVSNINPITKKFLIDPIYNYMDYWYQNRPEQISLLNKYGASPNIRQAVNDAKNISVYLLPFTDKYGPDVAGLYTGNVELYNKAFDPYGSWSTRSALLHELSHGLNDLIKQPIKDGGIYINKSPILEQVSDFKGDKYFGYHTDEKGERVPLFSNEYLDNPDEIYSRLMQFRYDQRIDPKKQYDDKDYLRFLDNGVLHKFNLDLYSQDYILHLLNNVVYNEQQDNDNEHISLKGGDIHSSHKAQDGKKLIITPELELQAKMRYSGYFNAMVNNGINPAYARDAAYYATLQSFAEAGWKPNKYNNYGGMKNSKELISYPSEEAYFDAWVKNANNKWPNYYKSQSIQDWDEALNHTSLGLFDKDLFYKYLKKNPNIYIYAPAWENDSYLNKMLGVKNRMDGALGVYPDDVFLEYTYNQDPLNQRIENNQVAQTYQYGGLIKPFSYADIPVVRYGNGRYSYI